MRSQHLLVALVLASGVILSWLATGGLACGGTALSAPPSESLAGVAEHDLLRRSSPGDVAGWYGRADSLISSQRLTMRTSDADGIVVLASGSCCEPLPPPTGNIIEVYPSQARQLDSIVAGAASGVTILLNDGVYELHGDCLWVDTPGLSIRSKSGNRDAVIIDGGYETMEIIHVCASNVTVADLTLKRAYYHPIHVAPPGDTDIANTLIYNVHIIDPGEQAIKINQNGGHFADYGVVACSRIELTDEGRTHIRNDCYTGGVDGHQARGWVIRDNHIEGFWCQYGLSEHGIHFWTGSRDTVVERNVLVDNCRGVGFGLGQSGSGRVYADNPCPGANGYVGHFGGVIRNNFIFQGRAELGSSEYGFDSGISLDQACGAEVLHNSVIAIETPFSSIEWRFSNTAAEIVNNVVSHNLMPRDGGSAILAGNLDYAPLSLFVDGANADLHLSEYAHSAIDQGVSIVAGKCDDDLDCDPRPRGSGHDIGADEWMGGGGSVSLSLHPGWNLVSMPIVPDDRSVAHVLSSIAGYYDLVSSYSNCLGVWLSYDPSSPGTATLAELYEGTAFWVRMTQADTLIVSGTTPGFTNQGLCQGWNMVAYPAAESRDVAQALSSISGYYTAVYAYEGGTSNPWKHYFVDAPPWANDLSQFEPGYGYWVRVSGNCTLTVEYWKSSREVEGAGFDSIQRGRPSPIRLWRRRNSFHTTETCSSKNLPGAEFLKDGILEPVADPLALIRAQNLSRYLPHPFAIRSKLRLFPGVQAN